MVELTDNKLIGKLGMCKTGDKDRVLVHRINPRPVIGTMDPSATHTLSLPEQGVYEVKRLDAHVMWLVAPESITQDLFV